jgi:hypothetical protein
METKKSPLIEAAKQALEALEEWEKSMSKGALEAHRILRTAIEAAKRQEPVAWMFQHDETGRMNYVSNDGLHNPSTFLEMNPRYALVCPLYTTPPAAPVQPVEMSPEFTDTARAALLWVLWHNQGGSSPVGQPIRFALGMDAHERLNPKQIAEAKSWAAQKGSTTADFHTPPPTPPAAQPAPNDFELMKCWVEKPDGTIDGISSMRLALSKYGTAQRQWVGLTDKEILSDDILRYYYGMNGGAGPVSQKGKKVVAAIEAKLKEKNQ